MEGTDPQYRVATVARTLLGALRARIGKEPTGTAATPPRPLPPQARPVDGRDLLSQLDLSQSLPKKAINDFEEQLSHNGGIVMKYWLQISREEQLRRFQEREKTLHKQFKITEEDWRNRKRWNQYQLAAADMIERTSTSIAPWTLVPSNDKYHARIQVITSLCDRIEAQL